MPLGHSVESAIEELRKRTSIDFVSSDSVIELQKGKSYKTLEKET